MFFLPFFAQTHNIDDNGSRVVYTASNDLLFKLSSPVFRVLLTRRTIRIRRPRSDGPVRFSGLRISPYTAESGSDGFVWKTAVNCTETIACLSKFAAFSSPSRTFGRRLPFPLGIPREYDDDDPSTDDFATRVHPSLLCEISRSKHDSYAQLMRVLSRRFAIYFKTKQRVRSEGMRGFRPSKSSSGSTVAEVGGGDTENENLL